MKYFKHPEDGQVYGYDESEPTQLPYIDKAIESEWEDVTGSWPPVPDPAQAFEQERVAALQRVFSLAQSARRQVVGTADAFEVAGWPAKLRIAQAIKAGKASEGDKAAFQAEIDLRGIPGETVKMLADKAIANAARFSIAVGVIDGVRRATQDAIGAAASQADIDAAIVAMSGTLASELSINP